MGNILSIIIPAKNEEKHIGKLLESIRYQDYTDIGRVPIFVADAQSTDATRKIAEGFKNDLSVSVIEGGPVSIGRNNGAKMSEEKYLLFLDADVELRDRSIIRRVIEKAERKNLHCAGAYIICPEGNIMDRFTYFLSNCVQFFSQFSSPFATGMFFFIKKDIFEKLGGFNSHVQYAEDYFLSKNISPSKFFIAGSVATTNRRFQKMGHWKIIKEFLRTALNAKNQSHFFRNKIDGYWE